MPKAEKLSDGTYPAQTFPGCYPLYYITNKGVVACPDCANDTTDEEDPIVSVEINHESYGLDCDVCWLPIPCAVYTKEEQLELRLKETN